MYNGCLYTKNLYSYVMQQSTIGALAFSFFFVVVFSYASSFSSPLVQLAALGASDIPAPVTTPSSPPIAIPPGTTLLGEKKPPEVGGTKCPDGAECKSSAKPGEAFDECKQPASASIKTECDKMKAIADKQKSKCTQGKGVKDQKESCDPYEIEKVVYNSKACLVKVAGKIVKCKEDPTDECPTYSSTKGASCSWEDPQCKCTKVGEKQDSEPLPSCPAGMSSAECVKKGLAVKVADLSGQTPVPGKSTDPFAGQTIPEGTQKPVAPAVTQTPPAPPATTPSAPATTPPAPSAPSTPASPAPVASQFRSPATSFSGVPASSPTPGSYGPFSSNYTSLQQYQPYGASPENTGRTYAPLSGARTPPASYSTVGSRFNNFVRSLSGAGVYSPEGVVYYQDQPIASYRTEDGAIVIEKVRVPRQTPAGDTTNSTDLIRALSATDVSVAARIRSAVARGAVSLTVPISADEQNKSFSSIENLIVQDEVAQALRIAEDAGISAKDSVACEVDETAQRCLARRVSLAQEVERRVFVDELNRRALSDNAVKHFVGMYDNIADPTSASYTSAVPSVLSQLNQPQQTSVIGNVVDAMGSAIHSLLSFIAGIL